GEMLLAAAGDDEVVCRAPARAEEAAQHRLAEPARAEDRNARAHRRTVTGSPTATRPGTSTQQSSATDPSNERTTRFSTEGSCSSVSGSNVVITQRDRRLRIPISTTPMR